MFLLPHRTRAAIQAAVLIAAVPLGAALGQQDTIVWQHGFGGDDGTWYSMAVQLSPVFNVHMARANTGWQRRFVDQADSLRRGYAPGPSRAFLVGHSFGGIVGREAVRQGSRWKALITVGTPNEGAPIAKSIVNGTASNTISNLTFAATLPWIAPRGRLDDWEEMMLEGTYDVVLDKVAQLATSLFVGNASSLVLPDGDPDSPFMTDLRSTTRVINEEAQVPYRQSMSGNISSSRGSYCRAAGGTAQVAQVCSATTILLDLFYMWKYLQYSGVTPWDSFYYGTYNSLAPLWLGGALQFRDVDYRWCILIGATWTNNATGGSCSTSDGLFEEWRTRIQGTGAFPHVALGDIGHGELTQHGTTRNELEKSLKLAGAPLRLAPPQSLTVSSLAGPGYLEPGYSGEYSVSAYGGIGLPNFSWRVDGILMQSGAAESFTYVAGSSDFTVSVTVTAGAELVTRSKVVTVGTCGPIACE